MRDIVSSYGAWGRRNAGELGAALCAAAWFVYLGYGPIVDPTFVQWMYRDDWATYQWGFAFFRNADWSWPLGAVPELFYPYGSSVAFMDANPWFAVLFRALSPLLPVDFQYHGLWLLLCFVLQAVAGAKLTAGVTGDAWQQGLGGALFAVTPILPARHPHIALSGIFFLTAGLAIALPPLANRAVATRRVGGSLLLLAWAAGTHGYLSVMLLGIAVAFYARLWLCERFLTPWQFLFFSAAALLASLSVYVLFGYVGWQQVDLGAEGFGQFSADLLALFNSQGWSKWVPSIRLRPRQHEGFAYLGTGIMLMLGIASIAALSAARRALSALRTRWPVIVVALGMGFYSLSSQVTLGGQTIVNLRSLYEPLSFFTDIFRSSGRFLWPLHLLLIAAAVWGVATLRSVSAGRAILLTALLMQVAEFNPGGINFAPAALKRLSHPAWESLERNYRHLRLLPIQLRWLCDYDHKLVNRLSEIAYHERLTFNSGNYMRKAEKAKRLCNRHLRHEALEPMTVYVVDRRYLRDFRGRDAICGKLDDQNVCVASGRDTPLVRALRASRAGHVHQTTRGEP